MVLRRGASLVLIAVLLMLSAGILFAQEGSEGLSGDQARAIIDLLQAKGIITEDEAAAFQEPAPEVGGNPAQAIIDLLKEKKVVTEDEATAFMERVGGMTDESETSLQMVAEPPPQPATKEELQALEDRVRRTNEATMLDKRLLERRIDDMEAGTLDALVDKSIKSEWAQRIAISGDVRLRYQYDAFVDGNDIFVEPGDTESVMNTTEDRHRFRYRARIGMKAKLLDFREANVGKMEAGFRFTTGNEKDPVSTNDTMGDYFNRDSFVFDRAYLKYKWNPINPFLGRMPQISIVGGRFANPWFSTDLVWDGDLNFEGLAATYETDTEGMKPFNMFATAGIFPLQEEEFSSRDKWLWGAQIGFEYLPRYDMAFTLGAAYYDYREVEGIQNTVDQPDLYDFTAPQFQQKGNTLMDIDPTSDIKTALATDYNILDLYFRANIGIFHPIRIVLDGQYVRNFGFDSTRVAAVTGNADPVEDTDGFMLGATFGYPRISNVGEWNLGLKYKHLGADAVLDAFTDSDFHLGGTNAKGWILKAEYGLYRNFWLTTRWLSSDEIEGPQLGVDTLQVDFNARF